MYAILFFKNAKDTKPDTNFNEIAVKGINGIAPYDSIKRELSHICWWINKALAFLHNERCLCVRKLYINSQKERDYYQPGKVFRMKSFTSAYKVDNYEEIKEKANDLIGDSEGKLVYFHIWSQSGRFINQFFPQKFLEQQKN